MYKYLAFVALAACSTTNSPIMTKPVQVSFSDFETAAKQSSIDFVEIRTTQGNIGQVTEVVGAKCQVTGHNYQAEFVTPAVVALPLFRGDTGNALLQCQAEVAGGSLSNSVEIRATNLSAPDGSGVTIKAGTGGASIGAVFSIRDKKKDRFDYPRTVKLQLK